MRVSAALAVVQALVLAWAVAVQAVAWAARAVILPPCPRVRFALANTHIAETVCRIWTLFLAS